ncbi:MAG: CAP domain-containing protein [Saprospiraceae bacterium]|uniref:CAP domain-containing protein n=1 Tax=Candidatus Defluviibacterium haderslevense TaxID=2981993 RepID=A0A9D7S8F7_9BACT|nr:CAP domain-containing protein [Candidatus Defluviibacterium haderslevense]
MHQIKIEMFNITNEVRIGFGLQPVSYSNYLDRMAQIHTNEMYIHKFFLHDNPYCKKVESLSDRVEYCGLVGLYEMIGENLADYLAVDKVILLSPLRKLVNSLKPSPLLPAKNLCRNIIKGWYNSPGHSANLLYPDYNYVGFGLLLYPKMCQGVKLKYLLVTQNFGKAR